MNIYGRVQEEVMKQDSQHCKTHLAIHMNRWYGFFLKKGSLHSDMMQIFLASLWLEPLFWPVVFTNILSVTGKHFHLLDLISFYLRFWTRGTKIFLDRSFPYFSYFPRFPIFFVWLVAAYLNNALLLAMLDLKKCIFSTWTVYQKN